MKGKMMEKVALYNGKEESTHKATKNTTAMKTTTSQAISALAHQVGLDDDIPSHFLSTREI